MKRDGPASSLQKYTLFFFYSINLLNVCDIESKCIYIYLNASNNYKVPFDNVFISEDCKQ